MLAKTEKALEEFLDAIEDEYGRLEGIEILLEHPIDNGERQKFASIKEINIMYLHKTRIDI